MSAVAKRVVVIALVAALSGCAAVRRSGGGYPGDKSPAFVVDAGGREIGALEAGSSLYVAGRSLRPNTMYEFRLTVDRPAARSLEEAVSFARTASDAQGRIPPLVLWYQSGVAGCSDRRADRAEDSLVRYETFEEAERSLSGKSLTVSVHPVEHDPSGRTPPMQLKVGAAESVIRLPVVSRRSPMVFASTSKGCLLNSQEAGTADLFVSGRNFVPGEVLEVSVVPNQRQWAVGDAVTDVTGDHRAEAPEQVVADAAGRFTVRAWERLRQLRGSFDLVAQHVDRGTTPFRPIGARDIVSYGAETGFILFLRYPVGGPTMDLAGRPLNSSPYFEFADSFAQTSDPVWGAVDPTYIPIGHPGGTFAAYYVVDHRDVAGWNPAMGGSTALVDVSGGIEVHPVKAGCINGTDVPIWNPPLTLGKYDVVVDFGSVPATTAGTYATDGQYDASVDFLDGADQVGFQVAPDPYELGSFPIGTDSYSQDDFFPTIGGASAIDLRAVVRYPATAAGAGTAVAAGTHPLFVIEHGNHGFCRVAGTHATCPVAQRVRNHEGYMRLLDILASHGVIAVSIDAYDLTGGVPQWIPERGQLILKHLELWSHMNDGTTFTSYPDFFTGRFNGHVDLSRIGVSGHSRGGEASVAAYMLNTNPGFTIRAVSSIAPVDGQSYVLPDVPYLVILPAADGDVSDLSGARIYDRAGSGLPTPDATTKSGIDVYGANHNFFNTVWAADGDDSVWPRPEGIAAADQQKIGEAYLAAFNRVQLLGETVYEDMLRGRLTFPSTAGFDIYALRHEKSHSRLMDGTLAGWTAGGGASVGTVSNPPPHQTSVARVGWSSGTATWSTTVPAAKRDASAFEVLALRAAQTTSASNPATGSQDFILEATGGGKTKGVAVSKFYRIPKPYPHPYGFFHTVLTAVRIPLHSFIMNNAGVTLDNIDTIQLRFQSPTAGELYVDDIEFSR